MLSALLPGVREFRTPLVTGLLWGMSVWLVFGSRILDSGSTKQFARQFESFALPPTVWIGFAALAASLIGSLLVVRTSPFSWLGRRKYFRELRETVDILSSGDVPKRLRDRPITWIWQKHVMNGRLDFMRRLGTQPDGPYLRVDGWLRNEFSGMWAEGRVPVTRSWDGGCTAPTGFHAFYDASTVKNHPGFVNQDDDLREYLAESFARDAKLEKDAIEVRIQMRFPEVYAEIDRLRVEGEFRLSIFWPLVVLGLTLSVSWSPWLVLLLAMPPMLARDGFLRIRQADEKTWGAFEAREVTSPMFDAMEAAREQPARDFRSRYENRPTHP